MSDPETPEPTSEQQNRSDERRAPFDSSDLVNIPPTTDDDPPYRNWWVVNDTDGY